MSDYELEKIESNRFSIETKNDVSDFEKKERNVSDFEISILESVRFWINFPSTRKNWIEYFKTCHIFSVLVSQFASFNEFIKRRHVLVMSSCILWVPLFKVFC